MIALIALVLGRYLMSKGAGTTNIVWGIITHDWKVALFVFLIGGISFTVVRERSYARTGVLLSLGCAKAGEARFELGVG